MSKGYREEWEVHVKIKKEREEKNTKLSMSEKQTCLEDNCWKKKKILFHLSHKIQEYDPLFILE